MAFGYPDFRRVVQDISGGYGARVTAAGYLATFSIEGSGYASTTNIVVHGQANVGAGVTSTGTWTNVDVSKFGKYVYLEVSNENNIDVQQIKLTDETTAVTISNMFFVGSIIIPLSGFVVAGTDTMKIWITNNAAGAIDFTYTVHFIEVPA